MRKCIQSGVFGVLACAMTMSLSAQQSYPPSSAQTPTGSKADSNKVTVTGCLAKATPSPTGTTGTAPGAAAPTDTTKFVLNDAMASASPTAGTAGAGAAATTASSYRLDGDDSKLTPHVGHKIEITGTVERPMADKTAEPGAGASSTSAPKLKVESVKMIASSCTP